MTQVCARIWFLAAGLALAPLTASAQDTPTPAPGAADQAPAGAETDLPAGVAAQGPAGDAARGDVVVAKVGTIEVTMAEIIAQMYSLPPEARKTEDFEQLYQSVLDERVNRLVVYLAALDAKLQEGPEHAMRMRLLEQRVLSDAYMQRELRARVNEAAQRARYDQLSAEMTGAEEVHARHILGQTEAEVVAHKAKIDAGTDFVELAKSLGFAGSENGGDLGFFRREAMVPEIAEAAFKLNAGEVSGPVQSQFGWHLIRVEERRPVPTPSFEDMQAQISQEMSQDVVSQVLAELAQKVQIQRFERDGSPSPPPPPPQSE